MLIHGPRGMGQQYLGAAVLHHFEKFHVQSFDLATLISDSTRSPEAAIVQLFVEIKRRKPSVIYIPEVDIWYRSIPEQALVTFKGLLQSIPSNEPVLLLGITGAEMKDLDPLMLQGLFGYSRKDRFELIRPGKVRFFFFIS
jgi:SpoVK/Ycf46/Vps4 family AAA+-type ATPase